jgi:hypothetical protein
MPSKSDDLIVAARDRELNAAKTALEREKRRSKALLSSLESVNEILAEQYAITPVPKRRKNRASKYLTRIIIPDSHGEHIDMTARNALLHDLELLNVDEIVWIGDHLDCGGTFSVHQRNYSHELTESYAADVHAANDFLDQVHKRAPNATQHYLEGNHEHHIERWASRSFTSSKDAELVIETLGPIGVLNLRKRGIHYYRQGEFHHGLSVPGTIKLGKCCFVHGFSAAKHSASVHLARVGDNIVFGHTHAVQAITERTVASRGQGAWSYGTLAKLQPLYKHTNPTNWVHAYGVHFVHAKTGLFAPIPIPIVDKRSLLLNVMEGIKGHV